MSRIRGGVSPVPGVRVSNRYRVSGTGYPVPENNIWCRISGSGTKYPVPVPNIGSDTATGPTPVIFEKLFGQNTLFK